jgi:hypothetical protein
LKDCVEDWLGAIEGLEMREDGEKRQAFLEGSRLMEAGRESQAFLSLGSKKRSGAAMGLGWEGVHRRKDSYTYGLLSLPLHPLPHRTLPIPTPKKSKLTNRFSIWQSINQRD